MRFARLPFGLSGQIAPTGSNPLASATGCIVYISAYETTGSASSTFEIYDGTKSNGQLITRYILSSGQSTSEGFGMHRIVLRDGIYINQVSGSTAGSISAWLDHDCEEWLDFERAIKYGQASKLLS